MPSPQGFCPNYGNEQDLLPAYDPEEEFNDQTSTPKAYNIIKQLERDTEMNPPYPEVWEVPEEDVEMEYI